MTRPNHTVTYDRDDNDTWFVKAVDVPGAHSYGRTIASARDHIREAIAVVLDVEPDDFDLSEEIRIPDASLEAAFETARASRASAEMAHDEALRSTAEALRLFDKSEMALSLRDLSELTGISFQRVQQVLSDIRERSEEYA